MQNFVGNVEVKFIRYKCLGKNQKRSWALSAHCGKKSQYLGMISVPVAVGKDIRTVMVNILDRIFVKIQDRY